MEFLKNLVMNKGGGFKIAGLVGAAIGAFGAGTLIQSSSVIMAVIVGAVGAVIGAFGANYVNEHMHGSGHNAPNVPAPATQQRLAASENQEIQVPQGIPARQQGIGIS